MVAFVRSVIWMKRYLLLVGQEALQQEGAGNPRSGSSISGESSLIDLRFLCTVDCRPDWLLHLDRY